MSRHHSIVSTIAETAAPIEGVCMYVCVFVLWKRNSGGLTRARRQWRALWCSRVRVDAAAVVVVVVVVVVEVKPALSLSMLCDRKS